MQDQQSQERRNSMSHSMRAASNKQRKALCKQPYHTSTTSSPKAQLNTTEKMASQSTACASEGVKHTNHRDPGPRTKFDPDTRWWAKKIHRYTRRDTQPRAATASHKSQHNNKHTINTPNANTHMEAQRIHYHITLSAMLRQTRMAWVSWSRMDHRSRLGRQT